MHMHYEWNESIENIDWSELEDLYERAPLGKKNPDKLRVAFSNSLYRWFIRHNGRLVGAGRALADGCECSYICDVALLPEYQGKGLGKAIVSKLVNQSSQHKRIILYSVPGKENFYKSLGFRRMTTAMAIFQNEQSYVDRGYLTDD